jgi:hypothetical protein
MKITGIAGECIQNKGSHKYENCGKTSRMEHKNLQVK